MKYFLITFSLALFISEKTFSQSVKGFEIIERKEQNKIDILYNGKLMTAYRYDDSVRKPFLFPLNTVDGITVTRGWPIEPRPGERTDHPHHNGMWMNYESVNGLDFWNNSTAIEPEKRNLYGTIRHDKVVSRKAEKDKAALIVTANWLHPDGHVLMKEKTTYLFSVKGNSFFIERATVLTADNEEVVFKDVKDGFFAIRVARELEMPSTQEDVFTDAQGNKTAVKKMASNAGVTGNYISSDGKTGDSVWSAKGRWAMLQGHKNGKDITIGMLDHPSNVGYPGYWHARGYGLFAINPLGRKIFSNGKEELNFTLKPHDSVKFRYEVVIASGKKLTGKEMNALADEFAK
ncbi:MAG: PmoA family protein [Bacteroidota bacterium]|nr:PmoA family protein [Bacteroidota bacterium]